MVEPFVMHYNATPVIRSLGAPAKLPCLCRARAPGSAKRWPLAASTVQLRFCPHR